MVGLNTLSGLHHYRSAQYISTGSVPETTSFSKYPPMTTPNYMGWKELPFWSNWILKHSIPPTCGQMAISYLLSQLDEQARHSWTVDFSILAQDKNCGKTAAHTTGGSKISGKLSGRVADQSRRRPTLSGTTPLQHFIDDIFLGHMKFTAKCISLEHLK